MAANSSRDPWNKGKLVEQKAPFKLEGSLGDPELFAIRDARDLGLAAAANKIARWPFEKK